MNPLAQKTMALTLSAFAVGMLVVFALVTFGIPALPVLILLGLLYGWIIQASLYYRSGRQDEFLHLLAGTAESGMPLGPALRAYLRDRPEQGWRSFWTAALLFFVAPGYYWTWHRWNSFDRKLGRVARHLEQGAPLQEALEAEPGIASQPTVLAVAVGESSGRLALSLRRALEGRLATVWLETLPRLLYPLLILLLLNSVGWFWLLFIFPRLERIYHDLGLKMPALTENVGHFGRVLDEDGGVLSLVVIVCLVLATLPIFDPSVRWYFPGVGPLYRMNVRSRVLKMLAVLLEAGKPVPEALAVLADSGAMPPTVVMRLDAVRFRVEQGEPLPDALYQSGLLPFAMAPLVSAAERAHNLPWALTEMGNVLASRSLYRTRRLSLLVFSFAVVAVGALVGFLVVGMFLPLVKIMSELS